MEKIATSIGIYNTASHYAKSVVKTLILRTLQIFAGIILAIMGWSRITKEIRHRFTREKRAILVFSHTTYWDFYIMLLYKFSHIDTLDGLKVLIKPQPFQYIGPFLRSVGGIQSTRLEEKSGGAVQRIVVDLTKYEKSLLLICPKGSILKKDWRSGYYHLARESGFPVIVVGLDYEKKMPYASEPIPNSLEREEMDIRIRGELSKVVPLFPEREVVEIREHDPAKRSVSRFTPNFGLLNTLLFTGYISSKLSSA